MKIGELIDGIIKRDLVLPEFQREYVWSREQAKQLMVSLVRDYPIGSLLSWKTDEPPKLKRIDKLPSKLGTLSVILDGQQRLTTLYMLITGKIPPFYCDEDIQTDPRELYYNLETGDFQYYLSTLMRDNPLWKRVVDCFQNKDINVFEIAKQQASSESKAFRLAQLYNENLNKLRNIKEIQLPFQMVPSHARLGDAIDIFDRVNSQGTKLTDAELALTHVTGKWAKARRVIKKAIADFDERQFFFDLTFMIRSLTVVVTNHALYHTIHDVSREEIEEGWKQLKRVLNYLITILPGQAFIHSTEDLNTTNVLIPLVAYLSLHGNKFYNENNLKLALHWLYAAQIFARYTGQTDQRLEHDVSLIVREKNPWSTLCNQIIDQRGRIDVKDSDFEGRGVQHPLFRMTYILAKTHGAVDWFNGTLLGTVQGDYYRIHNHHIFPISVLKKHKYDPQNLVHRKIMNEIANRAFLTAVTNRAISNKLPKNYLPEVEERYPGALCKQFIPLDPFLWKVENYRDFLRVRRGLIASKINEFITALITKPEKVHDRSIADIIKLGESATLEFKSTLQWSVVHNRIDKLLRHSVLKTIVAFLNSEGGTLVIGVEDNGEIFGLESDLKVLKKSWDKFLQLLTSLIKDYVGGAYASFIKIRIEKANGRRICVIDVTKASEPAFLKGAHGKEFHVRFGNTTRMLDAEETMRYIQMNWE